MNSSFVVGRRLGAWCLWTWLLAIFMTGVWAQPSPWQYTVNNGAITITQYTGRDRDVVVPETISGLPVTRLGPGAFHFVFPPITSLTLPTGITSIGELEFATLYRLANVTFLGRIDRIPNNAFFNCDNLVTVTYPDSLTSIGDNAFEGCRSLAAIRLPEGFTRIGSRAFFGCSMLANVVLPQSLTFIGSSAFVNCSKLDSLTISPNVTTIEPGAFSGCSLLQTIDVDAENAFYASAGGVVFDKGQTTLLVCPGGKSGSYIVPDSVTRIANEAFSGCAKLTGVQLPAGITSIGKNAFRFSGLLEMTIPEGVSRIESLTFAYCAKMVSISIPDSVQFIGTSAFDGCASLIELKISKNVTVIESPAFSGCTQLSAISVDALNTSYTSVDGVLFNKNQTTLLAYPGGKMGSYQIPATVKALESSAFYGNAHLETLVIPDTVTTLADNVFASSRELASVRIGRGITTIPFSAFGYCPNLATVVLPDTLRSIADFGFAYCPKLRSVIIPASVNSLGYFVFNSWSADDSNEPLGQRAISFEGNKPNINNTTPIVNYSTAGSPTVYYRAGRATWSGPFSDCPTVALTATLPTIFPEFGIRDGKFGLMIVGAASLNVVVEACTDLANPVWVPVGTHSLKDGAYAYNDPETGTHPARFYRLRSP